MLVKVSWTLSPGFASNLRRMRYLNKSGKIKRFAEIVCDRFCHGEKDLFPLYGIERVVFEIRLQTEGNQFLNMSILIMNLASLF